MKLPFSNRSNAFPLLTSFPNNLQLLASNNALCVCLSLYLSLYSLTLIHPFAFCEVEEEQCPTFHHVSSRRSLIQCSMHLECHHTNRPTHTNTYNDKHLSHFPLQDQRIPILALFANTPTYHSQTHFDQKL